MERAARGAGRGACADGPPQFAGTVTECGAKAGEALQQATRALQAVQLLEQQLRESDAARGSAAKAAATDQAARVAALEGAVSAEKVRPGARLARRHSR